MPNNREIAVLVWLVVAGVLASRLPDVRRPVKRAFRQAMQPAIIVPLLLVMAYVTAVVVGAAQIGIWTDDLTSATVVWAVGPGFGLLFSALELSKGKRSVRQIARQAVGLTVAIEFFVNLYVFGLAIELVLVPLVTVTMLMSVVAGMRTEHASVKWLIDGLLALIGIGLIVYVAFRLANDVGTVRGDALVRSLALPVWLTLATIPFVLALGSFLAYDQALRIVDAVSDGSYRRWQTARALVFGLRTDLAAVSALRGNWAHQLGRAMSKGEAAQAVRDFKTARAVARQEAIDAQDRLELYAGVAGTDNAGQQLDQREFEETRRALQLLASAQLGWYRNRGGRYRGELAELLASSFERCGLPSRHGIQVHVAPAGDAWWAGRRTVTGWCFAIGAAGPPDERPEQWLFDGPEPPTGFPERDASWGRPWGQDAIHW